MRSQLTEQCIKEWFKDIQKYFQDNKIEYVLRDPLRQFNGDETGFQLNPLTGMVLGPKGEGIYSEAGGTKTQVTVLITTRADGQLMPSAIVYPYKKAVPKEIVDDVPKC